MNVKRFLRLFMLVMVLITVSCGQDKKAGVDAEGKNDVSVQRNEETVKFLDQNTQKVYDFYIHIKEALVNSDSNTVQEEAKKAEKIMEESEEAKQLKATLKLISLTEDIKKQRDFFASLTIEVEKMVHTAKIQSGQVHKQFCPMAFEGQGGYWLSNSKEIRNPYYGSKMLKCGSIQKTWK